MTLAMLKSTEQVFCIKPLSRDLHFFFLIISLGMHFWKDDCEGKKCHSHDLILRECTMNTTYYCFSPQSPDWNSWSGFSTITLPLPLFPYYSLWKEFITCVLHLRDESYVAQLVKNPPAMRETWVWSPGWEDSLEKEKATHSSVLAWRIPWIV